MTEIPEVQRWYKYPKCPMQFYPSIHRVAYEIPAKTNKWTNRIRYFSYGHGLQFRWFKTSLEYYYGPEETKVVELQKDMNNPFVVKSSMVLAGPVIRVVTRMPHGLSMGIGSLVFLILILMLSS